MGEVAYETETMPCNRRAGEDYHEFDKWVGDPIPYLLSKDTCSLPPPKETCHRFFTRPYKCSSSEFALPSCLDVYNRSILLGELYKRPILLKALSERTLDLPVNSTLKRTTDTSDRESQKPEEMGEAAFVTETMPCNQRAGEDYLEFDKWEGGPILCCTPEYIGPLTLPKETCYPFSSEFALCCCPDVDKRPILLKALSRRDQYRVLFQPAHESETEYGRRPEYPQCPSKYGSGYGRKPEYDGGSGYGRKPEYERYESENGPGCGRKHDYGEPESGYGSDYRRKPQFEQPESECGSGYGRKPDYGRPESVYGSGYGRKPEYGELGSEYGSGYGRKPEYEGAGYVYGSGYGQRTEYGRPSEYGSGYGGRTGSSGSVYGRSEGQDYPGPGYGRRADEDSGYGGDSSYGSNGGDSSCGSDGGDPCHGGDGGDSSHGSDGGDSSYGSEESYGRNKCIILKKRKRSITTTRTITKRKRTAKTSDLFLMVMMP